MKTKRWIGIIIAAYLLLADCSVLTAQNVSFNSIMKQTQANATQMVNYLNTILASHANANKSKITGAQYYELQIDGLKPVILPDKPTCDAGAMLVKAALKKKLDEIYQTTKNNANKAGVNINWPDIKSLIDKLPYKCVEKTNDEIPDKVISRPVPPVILPKTGGATPSGSMIYDDEKRELSAAEIKDITDRCLKKNTYSSICDCLQMNYTSITGTDLPNSQLGMTDVEMDNAKRYNEYIQKVSDIVYEVKHEQLQEQFRHLEMAQLSDHVYLEGAKLPEGWEVATNTALLNKTVNDVLDEYNNNTNLNDGFHAEIYYNKNSEEYVLAFRGSQKPWHDIRDWITNGSQARGYDWYRRQYDKAIMLTQSLQATCKNCKISITGHSLGGGLASTVGIISELPTYTFNAAGVHENTVPARHRSKIKNAEYITAYYSNDDPLNMWQDKRYYDYAKTNPNTSALIAGMPNIDAVVDGMVRGGIAGSYITDNNVGPTAGAVSGVLSMFSANNIIDNTVNAVNAVNVGAASQIADNLAETLDGINPESKIGTTLNDMAKQTAETISEESFNRLANGLKANMEKLNLPAAVGNRINIGTTGSGHSMTGIVNRLERDFEMKKSQLNYEIDNLKEKLTNCMKLTTRLRLPE